MTSPEPVARAIAEEIAENLRDGQPLDAALDRLLQETRGRAAGLWRLQETRLALLGFRGVEDMASEVRRGFAEATRDVPLDQTGLGIVKAALTGRPAVAELERADLQGSATWLARFGARRSLAVPVERQGNTVGVLAVSTTESLDPGEVTCELLSGIAKRLGGVLSQVP